MNGVTVSDFYTPHYFDPVVNPAVRYSFTAAIKKPRDVLKGGISAGMISRRITGSRRRSSTEPSRNFETLGIDASDAGRTGALAAIRLRRTPAESGVCYHGATNLPGAGTIWDEQRGAHPLTHSAG